MPSPFTKVEQSFKTAQPYHNPLCHLKTLLNKDYPGFPNWVDLALEQKGREIPDWPDWCFIPVGLWLAIMREVFRVKDLTPDRILDVTRLAAIGTWRYSQGIYQLDQQLLDALVDSNVSDALPSEVFYRLPEWSIYVQTPGLVFNNNPLCGFWAFLDWNIDSNLTNLRFLLDFGDNFGPFSLPLGSWSLTEALELSIDEANKKIELFGIPVPAIRKESAAKRAQEIEPLVSILLYLCSNEPEIMNARFPNVVPKHPRLKKTKKGLRLFPPQSPTVWKVGTQIGQELRAALNMVPGDATGRTVKTHLRRGHHHAYWTGPIKTPGERKLISHWISPLIVRGSEIGATPPDNAP